MSSNGTRADLQPLARAISVDQAEAAARRRHQIVLNDLLYWAMRHLESPGDEKASAELARAIERGIASTDQVPDAVGFWVDAYAARHASSLVTHNGAGKH